MKARTLKRNKVNVITLGCSKNTYDSEVLMGQLQANQFDVQHESDAGDSNIIIINTCGFIESAKQESIDTILHFAESRKKGTIEKLYVTGCLSERYAADLEKEIPEVDAFFGTKELPKLLKTLKADYKKELLGDRLLTTPGHYAYFKISEGCDRPCSFCAIPLMRGKHQSVPIKELVLRAEKLAANGTKELILIAQDLTYYGLDLYKKRNLSELLRRISDVEGIEWIRLHYAFPSGFPMDILEVMKERSNICNYLDMPLQHISDSMLKSMKRGTTKARTTKLIDTIRNRLPEITLRTTLIAGYPGETEHDHQEMLEWVEATKFDRLGIFPYSHEENTTAYALDDNVTDRIKKRRADAVMNIQQAISFEKNKQKVGQQFKVLFDRREGENCIGRTQADSPEVDNEVWVKSTDKIKIGTFATVEITHADPYDLTGIIID